MRTEQDLRQSLQLFADRADLAARAREQTEQTKQTEQTEQVAAVSARRRRMVAVALVAATAVVAAVLLPQVVRDRTAVEPALAEAGGPPPFDLRVPAGWETDSAGRGERYWAVDITTRSWRCRIVAYRAGILGEGKIQGPRENLTLGTRPGYSALVRNQERVEEAPRPDRVVVWEYAPGAWATTFCDDDHGALYRQGPAALGSPQDKLNRRIAAAADFSRRPDPRTPARFGYLPAGYQLSETGRSLLPGQGDHGIRGYRVVAQRVGTTRPDRVVLSILRGEELPKLGERLTVGGYPARLEKDRTLRVRYRGFRLTLELRGTDLPNPRAELLRIHQELTVADPWNRATWLPSEVGL